MSKVRLDLDIKELQATIDADLRLTANEPRFGIAKFCEWLQGEASVGFGFRARIATGAVPATCTFTFTGLPTAAQTCTINGVTFTAVASGATNAQFNIGADATATAANMAAAINACSTAKIVNVVTATAAAGVVTITAVAPGLGGNAMIAPTNALTNASTSGAWANGAEGTITVLAAGR
jgi:hypothetical protein